MIATLILFGLLFGRWWRFALLVAAVGWPLLLLATGVMGVEPGLVGAAALAIVNTLAGVLPHQGILHLVRWLRRDRPFDGPSRLLRQLSGRRGVDVFLLLVLAAALVLALSSASLTGSDEEEAAPVAVENATNPDASGR